MHTCATIKIVGCKIPRKLSCSVIYYEILLLRTAMVLPRRQRFNRIQVNQGEELVVSGTDVRR